MPKKPTRREELELGILEAKKEVWDGLADVSKTARKYFPSILGAILKALARDFGNEYGYTGMPTSQRDKERSIGVDKTIDELEKVEWSSIPFNVKRFETAPCYICKYSGENYFLPAAHPCAEFYLKAKESIHG